MSSSQSIQKDSVTFASHITITDPTVDQPLQDSFSSSDDVTSSPTPAQPSYRVKKDARESEIEHVLLQQESTRPKNQNIESLTINKLRYDEIGIVGREQEKEVLQKCFSRLRHSESTSKQVVWIKGYSGCGKSTLARSLKASVAKSTSGIMIEGKFDLKSSSDRPYSGILVAFGQVFETLVPQRQTSERQLPMMKDNDSVASKIAEELRSELGSELDLLTNMIPHLQEVLQAKWGSSDRSIDSKGSISSSSTYERMQDGFGAGQERLKYAFRSLARVLSSHLAPFVVILDDLQWADTPSLDVLDYLISDKQNRNSVMVIGCYRADQVDDDHILATFIQSLLDKTDEYQFEMTDMVIDNFSATEVNQVIMKLLSIDDSNITDSLAKLCHKRTLGNPHFVVEFVTALKEEGFLKFNLGILKWVWDEQEIENMTMSTDNVVGFLQSRMMKLSSKLQLLLQHAACLGSFFDQSTLELVWSKYAEAKSMDSDTDGVASLLFTLEENKFIERTTKGTYKWAHDKVQEAALSSLEVSETEFRFEVGCILYKNLNEASLEASLFTVVDLINQGNVKRRPEFAALNLKAAEKARKMSAFRSAAQYVAHGVKMLPRERWELHPKLTFELFTVGAETELAIGNLEAMERYYEEAIQQDKFSTMERLPLSITQFQKMANVDLTYKESVDFLLGILKDLGCKLYKSRATSPFEAVRSLFATRKMVSKLPKDFQISQKRMTDPKQKAVVLLLAKLIYPCYTAELQWLLVLCITRLVQMTIQYGVHDMSGLGFSGFAFLIMSTFHDASTADPLGEMALCFQRQAHNGYDAASTQYTLYSYVFGWTRPLETKNFNAGFVAGMRSGNGLWAGWCLMSDKLDLAYRVGTPLQSALARCPDCLHQFTEMKLGEHSYVVRIHWQVFANLAGESEETTKLQGKHFDPDLMPPQTQAHKLNAYFGRLHLLNYYGDFLSAANLALEWGAPFQKTYAAHHSCQAEAFHRGLALYAAARDSQKRRFKRHAKRAHELISKWADAGCPNVQHFQVLLNAEKAAVDRKYELAESLYKEAIIKAARPGLVHDAALFSERYATFLRQPGSYFTGLEDEVRYRLQESIKYYGEWGAKKKVAMLQSLLESC